MFCPKCNAALEDGAKFCNVCGAAVETEPAQPVVVTPVSMPQREFTENDLPEQYRPLSPWSYFGLQLLYAVPIVGFIFLIIHSIKRDNINRRNFTRSYWCGLIIAAIIIGVILLLMLVLGIGFAGMSRSM